MCSALLFFRELEDEYQLNYSVEGEEKKKLQSPVGVGHLALGQVQSVTGLK